MDNWLGLSLEPLEIDSSPDSNQTADHFCKIFNHRRPLHTRLSLNAINSNYWKIFIQFTKKKTSIINERKKKPVDTADQADTHSMDPER